MKRFIVLSVLVLTAVVVFASCGGGGGGGGVSAVAGAPNAPSSLSATATSSGSIDLAWTDGSDNEDGFKIERSMDGTTFAEIGTTAVNTAAYSDTGLVAATKYYYRVKAYNGNGSSAFSNSADATTLAAPTSVPASPTNLTAVAASSTAIDLAWTDNADNEEGFKIERSASAASGFTEIAKVTANSSAYSDSGLNASTIYYYRVRAYNSLGDSGYTDTANATTQSKPGTVPAAPSGLAATAVSYNRIDLAWTDNSSNETGFTIERSPDGATFAVLKSLSSNITAHADTGLTASTTYYYRVKAVNSAGESAYSNTAMAVTQGSPDTDADGLSDDDEITKYGTNPQVMDTDGDGWSDFDEIVTMAFNPDPATGNPYSFNPHLADVPKIGIKITSPPLVDLNYTTTTGSSKLIGTTTTRSTESAKTVTQSASGSNTHTAESTYSDVVKNVSVNGSVSASGCASVSAGAGSNIDLGLFDLGADTSANTETCFESQVNTSLATSMEERTNTESTTNASTFSWSRTQAQENRQAYSDAESYETTNSINTSLSGGTDAVTVDIVNEGQMTFIPSNLVLSAVLYDPADPKKFSPVGNLTFEGGVFPANALAPGASATSLTFKNDKLSLNTVKNILRDPKGLVIKVATYDVLDQDGKSFNFNMTTINARTATMIIDYGDVNGRKPERYLVAADSIPGAPGVTLGTIMKDYLRMPYTAGTGTGAWNGFDLTGLLKVRDVETDPVERGYWMVVHTWFDPVQNKQTAKAYNLLVRPYDFDQIKVWDGHVVQLMYVEDKDKDGLNSLEEKLYGTSDNLKDTDGDGLDDYFEVKTGWTNGFTLAKVFSSPTLTDADGDGLGDKEEMVKGTDPWNPNTDGDTLPDNTDPDPITPDKSAPSTPQNVSATAVSGSQINLAWYASTDNSGVVGKYKVYRNSAYLKTVFSAVSASDTVLSEYTVYCYQITAVDATNNESPKSAQVCARTKDVTKPSVPTGIIVTAKGQSTINFSWTASSDNVGVTGYYVYRNSSLISSVAGASASDSGLADSTYYWYKVAAYDAAGNVSDQSGQVFAKTAPAAPVNLTALWSSPYMLTSWVDNSTDETGFSLERTGTSFMCNIITRVCKQVCGGPGSGGWIDLTGSSAYTKVDYKDGAVTSGGTYCYRVRAYRTDVGVKYYSDYSNTASLVKVP